MLWKAATIYGKRRNIKIGLKTEESSVTLVRKLENPQNMAQIKVDAKNVYQNTIKNEIKEQNKVFGKKRGYYDAKKDNKQR